LSKTKKEVLQKVGLPPGSLIHVGEKKTANVKITLINYNEDSFKEQELKSIDDCIPYLETRTVTWINIEGVHDEKIIEKIGKTFQIDHLTLEDIMNTNQRAKIEDFGNYLYFVLQTVFFQNKKIFSENLSIILGKNFVLSFVERENSVFKTIRDRIKNAAGQIRKKSNDYLAYALIDTITDDFFPALEQVSKKLEKLEGDLISNSTKETMNEIHNLKREIIFFLRIIKPIREITGHLQRESSENIQEDIKSYFRDVHDHVIHLIETLETYSEIDTGLYQLYLSSINNKMNEVMKVLTLIASIFIPLTFITGIYGINFANMPGLDSTNAYLILLIIMAIIACSMTVLFKKKKWI
jgi:magnesium transporter